MPFVVMMMAVGFAVGISIPAIGINYLYLRKPLALFMIDAVHFLFGMAAMSASGRFSDMHGQESAIFRLSLESCLSVALQWLKRLGGLVMSWFAFALLAAAGAEDCRMVPVSEKGRVREVLMCRDTDGQFRPRKNEIKPQALAPDFQGQIVYEGTIEGVSYVQSNRARQRARSGGLGSLIGGDIGRALGEAEKLATSASSNGNAGMVEDGTYGGTARITMSVDGNLVTLTSQPLQAQGLLPVTLTGTRTGSTCTLFDQQGKAKWEGRCDGNGFVGKGEGVIREAPLRRTWAQNIQARTVSVRTAAEIAAEQERRAAEIAAAREEARKAQETLIARMQAGKPLADRLDAIVTVDSQNWMFNRYERGSISNVVRKPTGGGKGNYIASANFAYAGGSLGSVQVKMVGDKIDCVEFGDFPGECRPLGVPSSLGVASTIVTAAFTNNGSSSSPSNCRYIEPGTMPGDNLC